MNHTRNIQGKDIERPPYPHWAEVRDRDGIVSLVSLTVDTMMDGRNVDLVDVKTRLETLFNSISVVS